MNGKVNSPTKQTSSNAGNTSSELTLERAEEGTGITGRVTEKSEGRISALLSWLLQRPVKGGVEKKVIDPSYRQVLDRGQLRIAELQANPELLEAAKLYLQENYPHLLNPHFKDQFLKQHSDEIDRLIVESYTARVERELAEGRITVTALMDPTVMEVARAYIARRHPHLDFSTPLDTSQLYEQLAREFRSQQEAEQNMNNVVHEPPHGDLVV
jgi:hypothetical protein